MKLSHLIAFSGCLLIFFACGNNKRSTTSVTAQNNRNLISSFESKSRSKQPITFPDDPASDRFLVDPEIAVITLNLRGSGNSFSETSELINNNTYIIFKSINQAKGCTVEVTDYSSPQKNYQSKVSFDKTPFSGSQEMKVTISFAGMTDIHARIEKLNKCMQTISEFELENPDPKKTSVRINVTKPLLTITNANKYSKQILAKKFSGLKEVAEIAPNPTQFNAKDTKCTTNGNVYITKRSLSKLELDVNFKCLQFGK